MTYLWIPATVLASGFQVARNGLQRELMGSTGPWGATLIRFLFGLPFSIAFLGLCLGLTPPVRFHATLAFAAAAFIGAIAQILGTASLLVSMRRAGFAIGTALQQSSIPLSAAAGLLAFHDGLSGLGWSGIAATTAGLLALTWPATKSPGEKPLSGAVFGLVSGLCFGFSLNAFRRAGLELAPHRPLISALASLVVVQSIQASGLTLYLALRDRSAMAAVFRSWRASSAAGLCGSIASAGWFFALSLTPAASVRALGVVEAPMAAIAGGRLFAERLSPRQWLAVALVAAGVLMTTLG